jgi:glycosyltransferase involved in cell wall biosynthesis
MYEEGISFIVRIRNEEDVLEESIRSLFRLKIPHEIILVLHCCTDRSLEISKRLAYENPAIRIVEYNIPVSRAGYETLCTNVDSKHSIVHYYKYCFELGTKPWLFKWDADFIASSDLIDYLNNNIWCAPDTSTEILISAISDDSKNTERYLFSGKFKFYKYWFWELHNATETARRLTIPYTITHNSLLKNKKSYWNETPWFHDETYLTEHPEERPEATNVLKKYTILSEVCGKEPSGQARASNPECALVYQNVRNKQAQLEAFGIFSNK